MAKADDKNQKAQASAELQVPKGYDRSQVLSSGKVVSIRSFKGSDLMEMMKHITSTKGGFDPSQMIFYVIAYCCIYDGNKLNFESLKSIDGFDLMELMAEFQGKF